jgi:pyridoxal 5'-phosphate synthase pdxT subunit
MRKEDGKSVLRIGVLAIQGSVEEHINMLEKISGVIPCKIKSAKDLDNISGIILPGGESTTIGKLMKDYDLIEPLKNKIKSGLPVWGTCAGMILLAKEIIGEDAIHIGVMDISVRRNAYGSHLDSFRTSIVIPKVCNDEIPLVFIRAPWVERVYKNVQILAQINDKIIAVEQDNILATSFHPELADSLCFHKYFVNKAIKWTSSNYIKTNS